RAPRGEGQPQDGAPREGRREDRNKRFEKFRRPEGGAPQAEGGEGRAPQRPRFDKPRFEKGEGRPQQEGRGKPRRDDRGNAPRNFSDAKPAPNREPDPDSPFAKLAALKAQMEGKK
ncbi:MAG: helicase, partial [Proteobacteria bacterium]|nr:helicase [Pseudomonadota bacterium]